MCREGRNKNDSVLATYHRSSVNIIYIISPNHIAQSALLLMWSIVPFPVDAVRRHLRYPLISFHFGQVGRLDPSMRHILRLGSSRLLHHTTISIDTSQARCHFSLPDDLDQSRGWNSGLVVVTDCNLLTICPWKEDVEFQ